MTVPPPGAHGGDGAVLAAALRVDPSAVLDLSMSLNPAAADAAEVVAKHLDALGRYPDPEPATVALAGVVGVAPERLVLTNGGAQAIALVGAELGGSVVEPDFSLYPRGGGPVWRSNPHNPSGRLAAPEDRADVWDEAFYPLATGRWTRGDGVVVGSLTKVFACPGLRVGYVVVPDPELADRLRARQPAWSVNGLAAAAVPDLLERADVPAWAAAVASGRRQLVDLLRAHGLEPDPSDAPWVLVRAPGLRARLAPHRVLVRDCSSFGLPDHVRIAVPSSAGLTRLAAALDEISHRTSAPKAPDRGVRLRGALMVCGTASDVGKSHVVTGLCRLLARRGVTVAPFKAQNMALNSYVTASGHEIGRAQGVQALAAGVDPEVAMNPILLKPTGERTSQVVVEGRPWAHLDAAAYHDAKPALVSVVLDSLADLRRRFDVVLLEGAGSPAEINLLDRDLVNLGLAARAGVPALVVGDIDRGGVFAALYGTVTLLPDSLRDLVRGFVVNKLRGDPALLADGPAELERRCGVPTLGVVPYLHDVALDAEDSLSLGRALSSRQGQVELDVAVLRFPRISNFTDFDALALEPGVGVRLVEHAGALGEPDVVVLPGTKATVADLAWLRGRGLERAVARARAAGAAVLGICGGYQMLGRSITDEVESGAGAVDGLGWLGGTATVFQPEKVTRQRRGRALGHRVAGYQIHHGRVSGGDPWIQLDDVYGTAADGAVADGVWGTTLHGLFEEDGFRAAFLAEVARRRGKQFIPAAGVSFAAAREAQFDRLADALDAHVDMAAVERVIRDGVPTP